MNQAAAKFVVSSQRSQKQIIEKSKLQFVFENFAEMPGNEVKVSPKVELFSVNAVWWTTVLGTPVVYDYQFGDTQTCTFEVHVEAKTECFSKPINFIAKGMIDSLEIIFPDVVQMNDDGKGMTKVEITMLNSPEYGKLAMKLASVRSSRGPLVIDFSLSVKHDCNEYTLSKFLDPISIKNQILSNNNQLLIDSKYSDFGFTVKGTDFKVHKAILGPASEVFANLFTSETEDSKANKCKIVHLDPIAFGHMLKFVYSGQLPEDFNVEIGLRLFEVAHFYDVKKLKKICEQEVLFGLNVGNALELYKLAQLYDLEELKEKSWVIVKRDLLKIYRPLKKEPMTLAEISDIMKQQEKESEYWENIFAE